MPILLFKSILSLFLIVPTFIAMFTMFAIIGRSMQKYDIIKLRIIHRVNGVIYFFLFFLLTYYCVNFLIATKVELSPRATFHSIFAFTIFLLFCLKVSFIRIYKQFYGYVKILGILIAFITFGMVGISGIYYLIVVEYGEHNTSNKIMESKMKGSTENPEGQEKRKIEVKIDAASVSKGKTLFNERCSFCHNSQSTKTSVGPGLLGILKNPTLPTSKKPATPENIAKQLKYPYKRMPSFTDLQEDEVVNLISFLNTI
jgi:hypothetical protein